MSKIENFLTMCASLVITPGQGLFCTIDRLENGLLHVTTMKCRDILPAWGDPYNPEDWVTLEEQSGTGTLDCSVAIKFFREKDHCYNGIISEDDIRKYFAGE